MTFYNKEPKWKKEILFNFLLAPFGLKVEDIIEVNTQEKLKGTIPDFNIVTKTNQIRYEVKIDNQKLTELEQNKKNRDAFLIRRNYQFESDIPKGLKILYWEDLFKLIDEQGAFNDFERLNLVREYMELDEQYTLSLKPLEVAMLYSVDVIHAVYTISDKVKRLCKSFLDDYSDKYTDINECPFDDGGIGYYFKEAKKKGREFFIGIDLTKDIDKKCSFSLELLDCKECPENAFHFRADVCIAYYPLEKTLLCKEYNSDEDLQKAFNDHVLEVLSTI